ncbi:MAG: ThiF family adenylyltransferase, partial [Planctomycetota bacterium]
MPDRYHRQSLLAELHGTPHEELKRSRAMIVGCGALGCAIAESLTRAGVAHLTIVDRDVVELTNLQRQSLFIEADAEEAKPKAIAARTRLEQINSEIEINAVVDHFSSVNARAITDIARPGVILDGTDNFQTRYLLNDLAIDRGIPFIYAGAVAMQATTAVIRPGRTPCLRCLEPDPPV